jgi:hypothetical protein
MNPLSALLQRVACVPILLIIAKYHELVRRMSQITKKEISLMRKSGRHPIHLGHPLSLSPPLSRF